MPNSLRNAELISTLLPRRNLEKPRPGFEPGTSALPGRRSTELSYRGSADFYAGGFKTLVRAFCDLKSRVPQFSILLSNAELAW